MNKLLALVAGLMVSALVLGLITININHHLTIPEYKSAQVTQHHFINGQFPFVHTQTDVRLKDTLGTTDTLEETLTVLDEASQGDVIIFHLSGYGGDGQAMFTLINEIHKTKAYTVMSVEGNVYSAHAYIATQGNTLIMTPYTFLMFHTLSIYGQDCSQAVGTDRTVSNAEKCQQVMDVLIAEANNLIRSVKILNIDEKLSIMTGHDVYITSQEYTKRTHA